MAAALWSGVFAAPHLYWAFGGRAGLGSDTAAADRALSSVSFAVYNGATAIAAVLATALALAWTTRRPAGRGATVTMWVTGMAAVVLGARGGLGLTLLGVDGLRGEPWPPPLLVAVEPWFVLGALVWWRVHRLLRAEP